MTTARKPAKKSAAKKTTKKTAAKKATAKKTAVKTIAKKVTKKAAAKKTPASKAPAAKSSSKKAAQHAAAKKTPAAPPAKSSSKKAAQHAAAKKTAAEVSPAKSSSKKAAQHAAAAKQAPPAKPAKVVAPPEPRMGDKYAILKSSYSRQPAADDINRVGGRPIGFDAASWPRRDGEPMHHVLTIDLKDHPAITPQRFRALALFISSPMKHEAYESGNSHTRVILLTEEDLKKGVPDYPPGLTKDTTLRAASLRFESAAELTRKKLYQESFAGDDPIWLQGDESDEDYDDYGDDDDDDSSDDDTDSDDSDDDTDNTPSQSVPHIFVLQFDERLVRGINLGDMGIMYVYADTAWFQCH